MNIIFKVSQHTAPPHVPKNAPKPFPPLIGLFSNSTSHYRYLYVTSLFSNSTSHYPYLYNY